MKALLIFACLAAAPSASFALDIQATPKHPVLVSMPGTLAGTPVFVSLIPPPPEDCKKVIPTFAPGFEREPSGQAVDFQQGPRDITQPCNATDGP